MLRFRLLCVAVLLLAGAAVPAAAFRRSCDTANDPMTVRNVGMLGLAAERRTFGESVQSLLGMNRLSEAAARTRQFNVPVVWHALQSNGEGSLTEAQVNAQISVLNSAFSQVGARFVLRELRQVEDAGKFACPQSEHDSIAQELAVDPGCAVNVYSCKPASGSLGRARLPGLPESDPRNWVFVRYDTLPGGDSSAFGYGDTLVHEVGHYFGLLHVFEGGECMDSSEDSGDKVVDTPAQSTPSYFTGLGGDACDTPKDTCPDLPGDDSVSNYMDYSGDLCMTEFTPGQELRMVAMIAQHKPSLWAGNCPTTSPATTPAATTAPATTAPPNTTSAPATTTAPAATTAPATTTAAPATTTAAPATTTAAPATTTAAAATTTAASTPGATPAPATTPAPAATTTPGPTAPGAQTTRASANTPRVNVNVRTRIPAATPWAPPTRQPPNGGDSTCPWWVPKWACDDGADADPQQPTPRVNVNFVPRAVRGADAAAAGGASGSQGGGVGNCPPWQPGCGEATTRAAARPWVAVAGTQQRGGGAEVRGAAAGGFAYDSGIGGVDLRAAASAEASASFGGFTGAETGSGPSTTPAETIAP